MSERKEIVYADLGVGINQSLYQVDVRRRDDQRCELSWNDLVGGYLLAWLHARGWSIVQEDWVKELQDATTTD